MRSNSIAMAAMLALVACTQAPNRAAHTVDEYRADEALRKAQIEWCANDPGTLKDTPDCINAQAAARLERKSLREMPPIGLKPATPPANEIEVNGREGAQ